MRIIIGTRLLLKNIRHFLKHLYFLTCLCFLTVYKGPGWINQGYNVDFKRYNIYRCCNPCEQSESITVTKNIYIFECIFLKFSP